MLEIDGTHGEGGGQILRSSLALSMVTGTPFRIRKIRGRRTRSGLLAQHATAVRAAAELCGAETEGAEKGSSELTFRPGPLQPGSHRFDVGTAGSATLVLQAVLPALLVDPAGTGPIELTVSGGTHNPGAPPFPFLDRAYLPLVRRMGARVEAELVRPGFAPAGGGEIRLTIDPVPRLEPLRLLERGALRSREARALVAHLPRHVAERELRVVRERLGWTDDELMVETVAASHGPGNVLLLDVTWQHVTEVVVAFGAPGKPAERVGAQAVAEMERHLATDAPVGEHLADQLLLPLAIAGGGAFRTVEPSLHTRTNAWVIERFLPGLVIRFVQEESAGVGVWTVEVKLRAPAADAA